VGNVCVIWPCTCGPEGDTAWRGQELYSVVVGISDGLGTCVWVCTLRGRRRGSFVALRSGVHGVGGPRSFVKAERDVREVRRWHKPQCLWAGLN